MPKFDRLVDIVKYQGYTSYTSYAINKTVALFDKYSEKGPQTTKVVILITDGLSSDASHLKYSSKLLRSNGILPICVGVVKASLDELQTISGNKNASNDRVIMLDNFSDLKTATEQVKDVALQYSYQELLTFNITVVLDETFSTYLLDENDSATKDFKTKTKSMIRDIIDSTGIVVHNIGDLNLEEGSIIINTQAKLSAIKDQGSFEQRLREAVSAKKTNGLYQNLILFTAQDLSPTTNTKQAETATAQPDYYNYYDTTGSPNNYVDYYDYYGGNETYYDYGNYTDGDNGTLSYPDYGYEDTTSDVAIYDVVTTPQPGIISDTTAQVIVDETTKPVAIADLQTTPKTILDRLLTTAAVAKPSDSATTESDDIFFQPEDTFYDETTIPSLTKSTTIAPAQKVDDPFPWWWILIGILLLLVLVGVFVFVCWCCRKGMCSCCFCSPCCAVRPKKREKEIAAAGKYEVPSDGSDSSDYEDDDSSDEENVQIEPANLYNSTPPTSLPTTDPSSVTVIREVAQQQQPITVTTVDEIAAPVPPVVVPITTTLKDSDEGSLPPPPPAIADSKEDVVRVAVYTGPGSHIAYLAPTNNDSFISNDSPNGSLPSPPPAMTEPDIYAIPQKPASPAPPQLSVHEQLAIATKAFDSRAREQVKPNYPEPVNVNDAPKRRAASPSRKKVEEKKPREREMAVDRPWSRHPDTRKASEFPDKIPRSNVVPKSERKPKSKSDLKRKEKKLRELIQDLNEAEVLQQKISRTKEWAHEQKQAPSSGVAAEDTKKRSKRREQQRGRPDDRRRNVNADKSKSRHRDRKQ